MNRIPRIALMGTAALFAVLVSGLGLVPIFVNPNDFKPEIEAAALRATGKELTLQGDITLSFFPRLSLEAGPAELKNSPSFRSETFARVEKITASVALWPLFSGRAEIRNIAIAGLLCNLETNASGEGNWSMPQSPKEASTPTPAQAKDDSPQTSIATIALESLTIEDAHITYADMRSTNGLRLALPVRDCKASFTAAKGLFVAKSITMTIAGGDILLDIAVDTREKEPRSRITGSWGSAAIAELAQAVGSRTTLTGSLHASWDIALSGASWPEASKTLEGVASAQITNGSLPGFTLIPAGVPGLPPSTMDLTNIGASGTWKIAEGIARNDDLHADTSGLTADGKGTVDIPGQSLRYTVSVNIPTLPGLPDLTVLPITLSGPFSSLSYGIDRPALARDTAKRLLKPADTIGRELERGLGTLLGR